jgi:hypothetical protein
VFWSCTAQVAESASKVKEGIRSPYREGILASVQPLPAAGADPPAAAGIFPAVCLANSSAFASGAAMTARIPSDSRH